MRQVCTVFIMAQLGCYVPAEECELTPADRIFTRIGANDNIMTGQSTFMVELLETSNILQGATQKSLVILDELGRGTSTFDGYSIAYGVLSYLTDHTCCRTLFSTHYHMLTDEFAFHPKIALYHMASELDEERQRVVYLYTLAEGAAPSSYGMNVARLAGVPEEVKKKQKLLVFFLFLFELTCPFWYLFPDCERSRRRSNVISDRNQSL
jgi:DNA mismatch repair protein MSH6